MWEKDRVISTRLLFFLVGEEYEYYRKIHAQPPRARVLFHHFYQVLMNRLSSVSCACHRYGPLCWSKNRCALKNAFFFGLGRTRNQETMAAPKFLWNALAELSEPSREERRAAIGRRLIKPTVKLRLPRGKARQIAWMSTIPGNHDEAASLHISDGIGALDKRNASSPHSPIFSLHFPIIIITILCCNAKFVTIIDICTRMMPGDF